MGLEPTTFELEVHRANPLRHGGHTHTARPMLNYNDFDMFDQLIEHLTFSLLFPKPHAKRC